MEPGLSVLIALFLMCDLGTRLEYCVAFCRIQGSGWNSVKDSVLWEVFLQCRWNSLLQDVNLQLSLRAAFSSFKILCFRWYSLFCWAGLDSQWNWAEIALSHWFSSPVCTVSQTVNTASEPVFTLGHHTDSTVYLRVPFGCGGGLISLQSWVFHWSRTVSTYILLWNILNNYRHHPCIFCIL